MLEQKANNYMYYLSEFYEKDGIYLPPEQEKSDFSYSDGVEAENYMLATIQNAVDISDGSLELMSAVKDWPSYYHLSTGRSNIFRTLDLPNDAKVLELGAGCGAITRYLGENFKAVDSVEGGVKRAKIARERCRDLCNVKIFCSNFDNIRFEPTYDIVTLIGVLEYAPKFYLSNKSISSNEACLALLEHAKKALKPDGILIVAIENKVGIKYWSGCPEDHTGKIYDSIHGYPEDNTAVTYSKRELDTLLKNAGFSKVSFYYCFPDYKFAFNVLSDLEEENFYLHNWVTVPFTSNNTLRSYTFHDGLAVKTLSEAGLLREFANSFLVIASPSSKSRIFPQPDWIAKRFSIRRPREFQCVTTLKIKPEPLIEKRKIWGNKKSVIIESGDIKIKHSIMDSPWIKGDLLIFDVYKYALEPDFKRKILIFLEEYYKKLLKIYDTGKKDIEGYPLLRSEAIDFLPRNIMKENSKWRIIDIEWYMNEYIPVDLVLYRCILTDIISSQKPWVSKRIKNFDKFTIKLIKHFFPNYGNSRHSGNKMLEDTFRKFVVKDAPDQIFLGPSKTIKLLKNNELLLRLSRFVWNMLPQKVKMEVKSFLLSS